jgi:hypothetical protein
MKTVKLDKGAVRASEHVATKLAHTFYVAGLVVALLIVLGQLQLVAFSLLDGHHTLAGAIVTPLILLVVLVLVATAKGQNWKNRRSDRVVFVASLVLACYLAWVQWVSLVARWWDRQLYPLPGYLGGDYSLIVLLLATPWLLLASERTTRRLAIDMLILLGLALIAWLLSLRMN